MQERGIRLPKYSPKVVMPMAPTPPRGALPWLRAEAARWQADGLLSPEQARAILARYPEEAPARGRSAAAFTILGAILVGLGAILFVAANWQRMAVPVRLALIFGTMLTSHGLGWWLWLRRPIWPRTGQALVLLGTLLYGAGIWLVAQIFHLNAHWPTGLLLWAVGALAVAGAGGARPNLALAALLLGIWTLAEQAGFGRLNPLFLPMAVAAGALAYRLQATESLLLSLAGLAAWQSGALVRWMAEWPGGLGAIPVGAALALLGLLYFAAAPWHEASPALRPLAWPYHLAGAVAGLAGLFLLTFRWEAPAPWPAATWLWVGLLAGLDLAAAATALRRGGRPAWPVALAVALGGATIPLTMAGAAATTLRLLLANALLLAAVAALVAQGFRQRNELLVNVALAAFLALVIRWYFDWFYTLMNRSLFFIGAGLLLLVGGLLLERTRRRLRGEGVGA